MIACSKNTRIISMNGGFVSNAMCDTCTTIVPDEDGLRKSWNPHFPGRSSRNIR